MNRLAAMVPGFFAMTLVAWTTSGHHMIPDPECKECDEDICDNENLLGFKEGSDDVLTP
jgi:hypothetical protein